MKTSKYPSEAYIVFYKSGTGTIAFIHYTINLKVIQNKVLYNINNTTDNNKCTVGEAVFLSLSSDNYKIVKNPIESRTIKALYFGENNGLP